MKLLQGPPKWFLHFSVFDMKDIKDRDIWIDLATCKVAISVFCSCFARCSFPVAFLHLEAAPSKAKPGSPVCHCVTSLLLGNGFQDGSGSSSQLSQAENAGNCCSVNVHPECRVWGGIKMCLFPSEIQDFLERRRFDWGHQLSPLGQGLELPCHCSEQAAEAAEQEGFGNWGFVGVSAS